MSQLELSTAISQSAVVAASRLYYLAIRACFLFFFVRFLGLENYGSFNYAQSWYILLMPFALLGTNELIISQIPLSSEPERERFLATSLALRFVSSTVTTLLIVAFALSVETDLVLQQLMLIFAPAALIRGCIGWFSAVFVAQGLVLRWTSFSTFFVTVDVVAVLLAAGNGASLLGLALLQLFLWLVKLLSCWLYAGRHGLLIGFDWSCLFRWDKALAVRFVLGGWPLALGNFLLLSLAIGLLIPYRLAASDLTSLGVAALVLQVLMLIQEPLTRTFNALLPALRHQGNTNPSRDNRFETQLSMFAILTGCVLVIVAHQLSLYLANTSQLPQFRPALLLLSEYAWVLVPIMLFHALRPLVIVDGRYWGYLLSIFAGFVSALSLLTGYAYLGALNPERLLLALGIGFTVLSLLALSNLLFSGKDWFRGSSRLVLLVGVSVSALICLSQVGQFPGYLQALGLFFATCGSGFFLLRLKVTHARS
ncbi:MAG: oligosaccharide flippase family protein [Pseudomonadota bacterium]